MPQKTWAVGEEVLAADFNSYVQQQVVATFATTAARDAWASPPNGALCITTDTYTTWLRKAGAWVATPTTRSGFQAVTTNGSGQVALTFNPALPAAPAVLASAGIYNLQALVTGSPTTTSATVTVVRIADNTTVNNFGINLMWIAATS